MQGFIDVLDERLKGSFLVSFSLYISWSQAGFTHSAFNSNIT